MTTETMKTFQLQDLQAAARMFVLPLVAFVLFLGLWDYSASRIQTSLGQVPGPVEVWEQAGNLIDEHRAEREKEVAFYERQEKRNQAKLAEDP
jgi:nitrate/nitrite transport system permease protein